MHFVKKITDDLTWVGANDRRLAMFEGVYSVPGGVSYNAYLLKDAKTVLFDTVDKAVRERFFENLEWAPDGRALDYVVVQHVEPDHSAVLPDLLLRHPGARVVCNAKSLAFIQQFHNIPGIAARAHIVKEGDTLATGRHTLRFAMAPMVHWPEVMVTHDSADKVLFSADAFGCFGALNGALFADEVDFERDYMDEARRYYANIVGKYGTQTTALLAKAAALDIRMVCPLHGFVWREKIQSIVSKYRLWGAYAPEERGVMIAYASVYGNTENAAEILSGRLREMGARTVMFDVSVTPASEIVAAAFKWSHLVFASTTYNAGIFVSMEALLNDLAAHNIQNRTVGLIENGSWAAASGGLMRGRLAACKNITFIEKTLGITSSLKPAQRAGIDAMADALAASLRPAPPPPMPQNAAGGAGRPAAPGALDARALSKVSYGLFVLSARHDGMDNGCVVNTVTQITDTPAQVSVAVHKANLTHGMVAGSGAFNVSVLTEGAPFSLFERFGFHSGRDAGKFAGLDGHARAANGILHLTRHANAVLSARVVKSVDCGTHTLFIADVTQAFALSDEPSVTYQHYFDRIKPSPPAKDARRGFVCKVCGYFYEGETLPADYVCPLCKHGPDDFEPFAA